MNCPRCGKRMVIKQVFVAGRQSRTKKLACAACDLIVTCAEIILYVDPTYGDGAYSVAKRLRAREAERPKRPFEL